MSSVPARLYARLVEDEEDHGCRELPESACREVPGNAGKLISGLTLQSLGDRIVDPKTILPWLMTSLGAPAFTIAMLVPIRESGSLLPQAALVPFVRRFSYRKRVWAIGSVAQGVAAVAIGIAAGLLTGVGGGLVVLFALAAFSVSRALSSISSKDLLGKTIPRGNRGSVAGIASSVAGLATIGAGTGMWMAAENAQPIVLALIVAGASLVWFGAAAVFMTVDEVPSSEEASDARATLAESLGLLRTDGSFRRFVVARTLMLATALSSPLVVAMSAETREEGISGVGPFVVASGVAGLISAPIWGRLADRSSRLVMAVASGSAGVTILVFLAGGWAGQDTSYWLGPTAYLALAIIHAGARMGRKTYVVDLGRGDERTRYVAVSNTVIGLLLLLTGLVSAVAAQIGPQPVLLGFAVLGLTGCLAALRMDEIHAPDHPRTRDR